MRTFENQRCVCFLSAVALQFVVGCASLDSGPDFVKVTQSIGDSRKAAELNEKGIRQFEQCRLDDASRIFREAIAADESFGPAHNNLGKSLFEKGNLYAAATAFETASQLMPNRADPFGNLGLTLEAAGKLNEAVGMYETAHGLEPTNPQYLGDLIRARIRQGETGEMLRIQLQQLLFIETRPEWVEWIQDQLAVFMNPRIQTQTISPEFNSDQNRMQTGNSFGPEVLSPETHDFQSLSPPKFDPPGFATPDAPGRATIYPPENPAGQ